jgi:4-hydroxymandelate oxidase
MSCASLGGAVNLRELGPLAAAKLTPSAWGYYSSGALDESTLADNEAAWARWLLRPRVLIDVSAVSIAVSCLGERWASPVVIAPMAAQRLAHDDGELATARGAQTAGCVFGLSTMSTVALEAVAATRRRTGGPCQWFQLYVFKDRALTENLVRRAEAAGFSALVVTVDAPFLGRREADVRSGFALPPGVEFANLASNSTSRAAVAAAKKQEPDGSKLAHLFVNQVDASLSWADVCWLRSITRLPVLVKGVLCAEDAVLAVQFGASGIVCSNHGGRQCDGVPAALDALPDVLAGAAGRVPVLVDGGVRRGSDVLKALALGASAVMLGRPVLYALALGGEQGVVDALRLLHDELALAMALCGVQSLPPQRSLLMRRDAPPLCKL